MNCMRSGEIPIRRGTRQGCPLSPLVFALCMEPFANLVRENTSIQGVKIKQQEVRISLFADDVVLYLTSPPRSIHHLNAILSDFAEVSGLQLNHSKSELYPIGIPSKGTVDSDCLKSFRWINKSWKYLGIYIPIKWEGLYKENFQRAYGEAQRTLDGVSKLQLSWIDRINIIKTFVNSKLLFLLRMLPICLPSRDLKRWQTMFNNFIWSYARHRIAHKILRIPQNKGSLGIPDIKAYYEAANLVTALRILTSTTDISWLDMETEGLPIYAPKDLFWLPSKVRKPLKVSNPFLAQTLHVWDLRKRRLVRKYSPYRTLVSLDWRNEELQPLLVNWSSLGICKLKDIVKNLNVLPRQDLDEKTHTHLNWFRYFQIRARILRQDIQQDLKKEKTDFEYLLALEDTSIKSKLSLIYKLLINMEMKPNVSLVGKWQQDCSTTFSHKRQEDMFTSRALSSTILPIKLQSLKLLYRWYTTPLKLHKMKIRPHGFCWKGCNQTADYIHCWWHCPTV